MLEATLGGLYLLVLAALMIYGVNAWIMVWLHLRHRSDPRPAPLPLEALPMVTIQLPLFNERYVAERVVQAAAAIDYPRDRLEIQVLDDSTDETSEIVAAVIARLAAEQGLEVIHRRRAGREGFKAGALADGLAACRGEFVAIFDADFVPPQDFLRRVLPHFAPGVAVVQTRWGHLNRSFSALTIAQALGMDGHFGVEQSARAWSGLLLNFNGTAGVWRKAAIVDAGGWQPDTLTEDLDLSYRAQLRGWRIVYRPEIVCPAELPVVVTGFKSQQRRWAKGSIQTARKLLPAVLRSPLTPWTKYQAFVHLTFYAIHPLMLASVLLLPLHLLHPPDAHNPATLTLMAMFGFATLGPIAMLAYAQCALDPRGWRRACQLPATLVLGVGVALSTSVAVLGAFRGGRREFVRTPKFGIESKGGSWRSKVYGERAAWLGAVEIALGAYCAATAWIVWSDGARGVVPFIAMYAAGFLTVGWLTVVQSLAIGARSARWLFRTLPTSAPGRIGRAAAIIALLALGAAPAAADPWKRLVVEGERLWSQSPDPTNPVACATCHHDATKISGWAGSFPKFKPAAPPAARVMTLWQANVEAVMRHYRPPAPRPIATAITAYLTALAGGRPITPGIAGQPIFEARMAALAESVMRGERHYTLLCSRCHTVGAVAAAVADLPRQIRAHAWPVEVFLEQHDAGGRRLAWDAAATADVMAYLVGRRAGHTLEPSRADLAQEAQR